MNDYESIDTAPLDGTTVLTDVGICRYIDPKC